MSLNPEAIRIIAEREMRAEAIRLAVDAEKARILAHRPFWSRFLAWLPFTFTWK